MIKRIIAALTICLIITGLLSPVFSDASALPQPNWSDPGISEVINISDLTNWMLNGGTYDVSRYTDAESFMNDYFNARTQTRLVSPGDVTEDYYEVLPGFGISNQLVPGESFARPLDTNRIMASSFRDHTGYGRRFSVQANESLLNTGSLYDMKIPLLNEVEFANFVGFNHNALRLYSEFFNNENPEPTPNPDPDFSFINDINSFNFTNNINLIGNPLVNFYNEFQSYYLNGSNNYTFYSINNLNNHSESHSSLGYIINSSLITIYLNSNDNGYSASYSGTNWLYLSNVFESNIGNWGQQNYYRVVPQNDYLYSDAAYSSSTPNLQTSFVGLSSAINYLYQHFININLYVDGELWALAGSTPSTPTITPEFPDAVGGEELPTTTWPISRPRAPYYTSVPGMLQAIEDAIQGDGKLDIDDLKPYLTDENGDPVPDPIFDPEPIPIPVPDPVNPDVVPGLPEIPAIPLDMPGYNGVSVLAEIINFTNQSLPTSLIVTFWGIVFGIVILGLIKILHK